MTGFTNASGFEQPVMIHIRVTARRLARSRAIPSMDADDIEQDLFLDLWTRKRAYDPNRASFRTFASRVVDNRVATLTAPCARLAAERQLISLDEPADGNSNSAPTQDRPTLPSGFEEQMALVIDVRTFVASLTPAMKRYVAIVLSPHCGLAAAKHGLHRATVYEGLARLRLRAERAGLGEYLQHPDKSPCAPVDIDMPSTKTPYPTATAVRHLNQSELAQRWRISPRTLERQRYLGFGPAYVKIGAHVVYRMADIEAYEDAQLQLGGQ